LLSQCSSQALGVSHYCSMKNMSFVFIFIVVGIAAASEKNEENINETAIGTFELGGTPPSQIEEQRRMADSSVVYFVGSPDTLPDVPEDQWPDAGISATNCGPLGFYVFADNDRDQWRKIPAPDGSFKLENVKRPGWYMAARNVEGWDRNYMKYMDIMDDPSYPGAVFRSEPALDRDLAKVSLAVVAAPGHYVCHIWNKVWFNSFAIRSEPDEDKFRADCSWHMNNVGDGGGAARAKAEELIVIM